MPNDNKDKNVEKIVAPGDVLGVIEEFAPGKNCYEDEGQIISETWGKLKRENDHEIQIEPLKKLLVPRKGVFALGIVTELRRQSASVSLSHFRFGRSKEFRSLSSSIKTSLHISNVSDRFIRAIHDAVRPGDYILCKVLATNPEFKVSLFGSRELGVISAVCYSCGHEIDRYFKRNLLKCNNCGATQNRVLSQHFGRLEKFV